MHARERLREINEIQKNREIDKELAMKDEKLQRQGGILETEF